MDEGEATRSGPPDSNPPTVLCGAGLPAPALPLGPREAFLAAHERLSTLADIAGPAALVVAAVDPQARVAGALLLRDRGALIVGRHTQCGLRLPGEAVSLRHLAVLLRIDEARPVTHLWDLNTGLPFLTEDGSRNGAVVADGPVYAAIGGSALWIVPSKVAAAWPARAAEAWSALPPREFVDRRAPAGAPPPARSAARRSPGDDEPRTQVTSIGPPMLLGDGAEPEVGWGVLRFGLGGVKQRRRVSAERLEQGILVGRYARCGLSIGEGTSLSRVHLLLVRIGAELWAIDTASTNGVSRGATALVAEVLHDSDAISLAGELSIDWEREKHAEA